jgi:galactose mutarotase-like enzyme
MLTHGVLNQHATLTVDNGVLRVVILPQKGADIYALIHVASGIDFLLKTPAGLQPPTGHPPRGFLENYEGGWQVLLPNGNAACQYQGRLIPFHGEAALLPWKIMEERDDARETLIRLAVRCQCLPLRVERCLCLRAGTPRLEIDDQVTNEGSEPTPFIWGQHLVMGGDFLEAGCRLETSAHTIVTPEELYEPQTAVLAPGQREPWPLALGRQPGARVDLRAIPGADAHTHDDSFLTDFDTGNFTVTNPRRGLSFRLDWDAALFPYLALWQPYGGATQAPLAGIYGLGLEPWSARWNLEAALHHSEAMELAPGASIQTAYCVSVAEDSSQAT